MLPVIALVGRPNVGKSTLFNRLTRSRDALVADQPGLTRDRQYGIGQIGNRPYVVVDTGGISGGRDGVEVLMDRQVRLAIDEADHIFYLVDAREGMAGADENIAVELRKTGTPVTVVANKSESLDRDVAGLEFFAMGMGQPVAVSAAHGGGVKPLMNQVLNHFPAAEEETDSAQDRGVQIAVVGRPNVGKSTLINRLLGEERLVTFDQPGTTRDSIFVPFEHEGKQYTLIDTAGVRRRSRIDEAIEKFSVIKTLQAMAAANVVLLVLDAHQGVSEQDATLAGHVVESGRALVVVINKWDGLESDQRDQVKSELERKLPFLEFAEVHFISALHGTGVGLLMQAVNAAFKAATSDLKTADLTRILEQAVREHQPPMARGRRVKLRYAHQGGRNPPLIIIHGNQTDAVPATYQRFLVNRFRKAFKLWGTPVRIEFRTGDNPFKNRRNKLTERQVQKRKRLMKFAKRK
jgi:GTP-binding protein